MFYSADSDLTDGSCVANLKRFFTKDSCRLSGEVTVSESREVKVVFFGLEGFIRGCF